MTQRPAFIPHPRWPSGSPPLMSVRVPPLHTCSDTPLAHPSWVSRDCPRSAPLPPLCHLHHCLNSGHLDDCQAAQQASRRHLSLSQAGSSPPGLPCASDERAMALGLGAHCPPARDMHPFSIHLPALLTSQGPAQPHCAVGTPFPRSLCVLSSAGRVTLVNPQRACWVRQGDSPRSTAMKANQCPQLCSFFGSPGLVCPKGAYTVLLRWPQPSLRTSFGGGEETVAPDNALFFM